MDRFSDTLMEHFQAPINRGVMAQPDFVGTGSLDGYPPYVTLYLRIDEERVSEARFEAEGCGVTIACGSMLTELLRGRKSTACRQLTVEELWRALDGAPPGKDYCAHVVVSALRDALSKWSAETLSGQAAARPPEA